MPRLAVYPPDEVERIARVAQRLGAVVDSIAADPPETSVALFDRLDRELAERGLSVVRAPIASEPRTWRTLTLGPKLPGGAHADDAYDANTPASVATLDVAVRDSDGWHADASRAFVLGVGDEGRARAQRLVDAANAVTRAGIVAIRPGGRWSDAMESMTEAAAGLGVEIVPGHDGHGIGRSPHERPRVPMTPGGGSLADFECRPGLVYTVEPIVREQISGFDRVPWYACREETVGVSAGGVRVLTQEAARDGLGKSGGGA